MTTTIVIASPKFGKVRTQLIEGAVYYSLRDVCEVLQFSNTKQAADTWCKGVKKSYTLTSGGQQLVAFIPREDVNRLVMRSRRPEARDIQDWMAAEVLTDMQDAARPEPKRQGVVSAASIAAIQQGYSELMRLCGRLQEQVEVQEEFILELKPKAEFYDAVADAGNAHTFEEAAKILGLPGIGRNNLFKALVARKVLMVSRLPYQEYKERGYFKVIESRYVKPNGVHMVATQTLITPKGLDFVRRLLTPPSGIIKVS